MPLDIYVSGGICRKYEHQVQMSATYLYLMQIKVGLFGKLATQFSDSHIRSINDKKILVVLSGCKVVLFEGVPALQTTAASVLYLNIPINDVDLLNAVVPGPAIFILEQEKRDDAFLDVMTIPALYKRLREGVVKGTCFAIIGNIVGVDSNDWKYVPCSICRKKVVLCHGRFFCFHCNKKVQNPREGFKLVVQLAGCNERITCVLFNESAFPLLRMNVDDLVVASMSEGRDSSTWIENYLNDSLLCLTVVLGIKINDYNLPPKSDLSFNVTKFYHVVTADPPTTPMLVHGQNVTAVETDTTVASAQSPAVQHNEQHVPTSTTNETELSPFSLDTPTAIVNPEEDADATMNGAAFDASTLPLDSTNANTHDPSHTIQDDVFSTTNTLADIESNTLPVPGILEDALPVISMVTSSNINLDDCHTSMSADMEMESNMEMEVSTVTPSNINLHDCGTSMSANMEMEDNTDSDDATEDDESDKSMSGGTDVEE